MTAVALSGGCVMGKWREALLLFVVTGFVWYLFLAPQQGSGSVDSRAKQSLEHGQMAIKMAARDLLR
jgi:hypothetical protein